MWWVNFPIEYANIIVESTNCIPGSILPCSNHSHSCLAYFHPIIIYYNYILKLPFIWLSRLLITDTAWCNIINFVCALSVCKYWWHISPNSLKASLISLTRTLKWKEDGVYISYFWKQSLTTITWLLGL